MQCPDERPCPYVSCRYHLLLNAGNRGRLVIQGTGEKEPPASTPADELDLLVAIWADSAVDRLIEMPDSCALDIAQRGPCLHSEIAAALGVTKQRVYQIELEALAKLGELVGLKKKWRKQ